MRINHRKSWILVISFLLFLLNIASKEIFVIAKDNNRSMENNTDLTLMNDMNWKKLKNVWKMLNHFEVSDSSQDNFDELQKLQSEINRTEGYLNGLVHSHQITQEDKEFIFSLFNERYSYLQFKVGLVMCYSMSQKGYEISQKRGDLEKRFDSLEKLYKEGKINDETFKLTVKKLSDDLTFIEVNSKDDPNIKLNKNLIDLIAALNNN